LQVTTSRTAMRPSVGHRLKIFALTNPWLLYAAGTTLCDIMWLCSQTADHCAVQCKGVCSVLLLVGIVVRIPPVAWIISVSVWLCRPLCYDVATERFAQFASGKKVKVTIVHALRLCTGRTAHRGSRGIAVLFNDHGTRRGWGVSVTPRPLFTPGKDPVPVVQEVGWSPGPVWTGAENLAPPPGFDPRTVQPVASRNTDQFTSMQIIFM
jgi:hypothetical protein